MEEEINTATAELEGAENNRTTKQNDLEYVVQIFS